MSPRPATYPLIASVLVHLAGLASASGLVELRGPAVSPELIPIELGFVLPPSAEPPPRPEPEPAAPRDVQPTTPPRLIETPRPEVMTESAAPQAQDLLPSPQPTPTAEEEERPPGPMLPVSSTTPPESLPDNASAPATEAAQEASTSAPAGGGEAGAARLFAKGDVAVLSGTEAGDPVGLARPRGGYQIKPRYPESARRRGIQGTSLLRLRVLTDGTVGEILLQRSAGHQDLDRAALEAVKKWRFEPARREGKPVVVWVVIPVQFKLRG